MELYNVLKSLNVDELKTVKKIATDLIKEKQPKKVSKTRDDKIKEVHQKLKSETYGYVSDLYRLLYENIYLVIISISYFPNPSFGFSPKALFIKAISFLRFTVTG